MAEAASPRSPHAPHGPGPHFAIPASRDSLSLYGYLASRESLYAGALEIAQSMEGGLDATGRVLDAGGSFGAFALAAATLGAHVSSFEPLRELGDAAGPLRLVLEQASVETSSDGGALKPSGVAEEEFDLLVCLALQSNAAPPERVAKAATTLVKPGGGLVLAVPNARYWPARLKELRGRAARAPAGLVPVCEASHSESTLRAFLGAHQLRVGSVRGHNASPRGLGGPRQQLALDGVMRAARYRREILLALAYRPGKVAPC